MFRDADVATIIYTPNPPGRLQEAVDAVQANEESWKKITEGPLFIANAADPPAARAQAADAVDQLLTGLRVTRAKRRSPQPSTGSAEPSERLTRARSSRRARS